MEYAQVEYVSVGRSLTRPIQNYCHAFEYFIVQLPVILMLSSRNDEDSWM